MVNGIWTAKTFYFYLVSVIIIIIGSIWWFFRKEGVKISLNRIDMFLLAYYFYNIIRLIFTEHIPLYNARMITFTFLIVFYFIFKYFLMDFNLNKFTPAYILIIAFLAAGFWQASIGLFQSHNLFGYYSGYFKVLGTFGNPAPYTGFIISVLPFAFGLYLLLDDKSIYSKILKYASGLTFAVTLLVLPATKTRGGWLAALAGMIAVIFYKYELSKKLKAVLDKRVKKIIATFSIVSIVVLLFIGLYQIRPSSAFGRLLIWKVSITSIIPESPIFGIGYDRFGQVYNKFQGNYFAEEKRDDFEKYVAGNVKQTHNEYIEQFAELGLLGFLLFIGLFSSSLYGAKFTIPNKQLSTTTFGLQYSARASIIALIVSACFSYPFQILPTLLNFIFLLSIITSFGNYKILHTVQIKNSYLKYLTIIVLPMLMLFSVTQIEKYNNLIKWNEAVALSHYQSYDKAINIYKDLYPKLKTTGNFLVNYGGVLSLNEQHKEAIKILEDGKIINSDPNLFISLANSYKAIGNYKQSENNYIVASNIIPHKFYSKYLLAQLYSESNQLKKAKETAKEILKMEEKIPSSATREIKREMQKLLKNKMLGRAK